MAAPHSDHFVTVKAVVALLIVFLAFGIFLLFMNYRDSLEAAGTIQSFVMLTVVGMVFLVGLLYLVNKPHHQKVVRSASRSVSKKKRR